MSHRNIGYREVCASGSFKCVSYSFQTINITTTATGYGLGLACDTLVAQVCPPLIFTNSSSPLVIHYTVFSTDKHGLCCCADIWWQEPAAGGSDPSAGHHHPAVVLPALLGSAHQCPGHPAVPGPEPWGDQVTDGTVKLSASVHEWGLVRAWDLIPLNTSTFK